MTDSQTHRFVTLTAGQYRAWATMDLSSLTALTLRRRGAFRIFSVWPSLSKTIMEMRTTCRRALQVPLWESKENEVDKSEWRSRRSMNREGQGGSQGQGGAWKFANFARRPRKMSAAQVLEPSSRKMCKETIGCCYSPSRHLSTLSLSEGADQLERTWSCRCLSYAYLQMMLPYRHYLVINGAVIILAFNRSIIMSMELSILGSLVLYGSWTGEGDLNKQPKMASRRHYNSSEIVTSTATILVAEGDRMNGVILKTNSNNSFQRLANNRTWELRQVLNRRHRACVSFFCCRLLLLPWETVSSQQLFSVKTM